MASFVWSDIPKLSFGSCSSLIKLSCLRLAMGHSYLVSLGGSRSSEADLGPTLLPLPAWKASDHSTWKADFSPGTYDHHYSSSNKEHIEYIRKPGREPTRTCRKLFEYPQDQPARWIFGDRDPQANPGHCHTAWGHARLTPLHISMPTCEVMCWQWQTDRHTDALQKTGTTQMFSTQILVWQSWFCNCNISVFLGAASRPMACLLPVQNSSSWWGRAGAGCCLWPQDPTWHSLLQSPSPESVKSFWFFSGKGRNRTTASKRASGPTFLQDDASSMGCHGLSASPQPPPSAGAHVGMQNRCSTSWWGLSTAPLLGRPWEQPSSPPTALLSSFPCWGWGTCVRWVPWFSKISPWS